MIPHFSVPAQAKPEPCPGHHGDKNETTFKINIYFY